MPLQIDPDAPKDFDFIIGKWIVKHKRLNSRLSNCDEWTEFEGLSETMKILGGFGNLANLVAGWAQSNAFGHAGNRKIYR